MNDTFKKHCMDMCVDLAGRCSAEDATPRPKVAAVLTHEGNILETAFRGEIKPGDHAEYTLLKKKLRGPPPKGSHLFVTLEPCSQRGRGKISCADHVISAGIRRVTIGALDPNPQIYARGQQRLMEAGVEVDFFDASHASRLNSLNTAFNSLFSNVTIDMIERSAPNDRWLIVLCGPSSSGKDTILAQIRGRLIDLGVTSEFLRKITTRPERPGERNVISQQWMDPSSGYEFVSAEKFLGRRDIVANYEKYGCSYGFVGSHLTSERRQDKILFAIFGDIDALAEVVPNIERETKRRVLVYLLRADLGELESRLKRRRGFVEAALQVRLDELKADYARIERLIKRRGNFKYFTNANVDDPDRVAEMLLRDSLFQMGMLSDGGVLSR